MLCCKGSLASRTTREQGRSIAKSERRGAAGEALGNGDDSSVEVDVGPPISWPSSTAFSRQLSIVLLASNLNVLFACNEAGCGEVH